MKKAKKGFTLVELLVVIAIIAILAAIIAPNAFKAIEKSKVATAEADYKAIKTAALGYYTDTGAWPVTGAGDSGFVKDPGISGLTNWNGPYLEKWKAKNPWGGDYALETTVDKVQLKLTSVPAEAGKRIEMDLDGEVNSTKGIATYDSTNKNMIIIISQQ